MVMDGSHPEEALAFGQLEVADLENVRDDLHHEYAAYEEEEKLFFHDERQHAEDAAEGEAAFRRMEREFVETGHPAARTVVACGGGLVVQDGILERLRERGVVICLHASLETILARTERQSSRPLLNVENPTQRIRTLYAEREPIYRSAGTVVLTDSRPLREVAAHVIRVWERDARDFARTR